MSYILDALKKSERERRQSSMHGTPTINDNISDRTQRRPLRSYLIIAGLALSAGILVTWAGISYLQKPAVTLKLTSAIPRELDKQDGGRMASSAQSESIASIRENREQRMKPLSSKGESVDSIGSNGEQRVASVIDTGGAKKTGGIQQKRPARADVKSQKKDMDLRKKPLDKEGLYSRDPSVISKKAEVEYVASGPKPDNDSAVPVPISSKIYNLGELPPSVRQGLPAFSVSVFLYSDEVASRMVKINGQILKEGQSLTEGLKLEKIIPNGLIFSYHSYRFHVDLK